jgi:hypothetical protein
MFASTCPASFDTRLILYEGNCSSLSCLANRDDGCGRDRGSSLSWNSEAGAAYQIQVTGYDRGDAGPFALRVDGASATLIGSPSMYRILY